MWILPKQLHTSPFVPDTAALISDSTEQSEICAQSLLARSKPSPARTWSQRWKRDSWTQHLSGRILKPSHGQTFVTAWTSALSVIHASHLVQPVNDSEQKIPDTSGHLLQPELLKCDQVSVSPKTSRDISALGYPTFCKTWQDWVTERRGAWRARVNAARHTSAKGSSSWPTVTANEDSYRIGGESQQSKCLSAMARRGEMDVDWRTPTAETLGTGEHMDSAQLKLGARVYNKNGKLMAVDLNRQVEILRRQSGQAAPASSSSLGSRQGLSWATPAARDTQGKRGAAANARKGNPLDTLPNQMAQWGTPTARDHKSGRGNEQREYKELTPMVERQQTGKLNSQWVTQLMGLPLGFVSPSCPASVIKNWPRFVTGWLQATIAPTSCDSSETALCRPSQSERSDFFLAS
jgi:hypothetical protein